MNPISYQIVDIENYAKNFSFRIVFQFDTKFTLRLQISKTIAKKYEVLWKRGNKSPLPKRSSESLEKKIP